MQAKQEQVAGASSQQPSRELGACKSFHVIKCKTEKKRQPVHVKCETVRKQRLKAFNTLNACKFPIDRL